MRPEKLWNKRYVHLLLIEITMQLALYLTRPIASSYAVSLGASVTMAGFVAGLLATGAVVTRPLSGAFSDLFNKKCLLVLATVLFTVSTFGCVWVDSVLALALFYAIQGFAFAFKSTLIISFAALVVPKKNIGSGVAWLSVAYTIACSIGPAIGAYVGGSFGYPAVYFLSTIMLAIGLVLVLTFREPVEMEARRITQSTRGLLGNFKPSIVFKPSKLFHVPTLTYSLIAGLMMVAQGINNTFMVLMENQGEVSGAPLYFIAYSIVALVSKPVAGKICDKHGVSAVVTPALFIAIVGMLLMTVFRSAVAIVIAAVCMALGQATAYSTIQAESVRNIDSKRIGRSANTFYIGPDLGMGLGPVLGGFILQTLGASMVFAFNATVIFLSLVLFLSYQKAVREK